MTWVDLKRVEAKLEQQIMVMINKNPEQGYDIEGVKDYFRARPQAVTLGDSLPGWSDLSEIKRRQKVDRVIARLIKGGRVRIEKKKSIGFYPRMGSYLVPLNVLDKIVFALEQVDEREGATVEGREET